MSRILSRSISLWLFVAGLAVSWNFLSARETAPAPRAVTDTTTSPTELDDWLIREIHQRSQLMANLEYLSDVIGFRLTGSTNLVKANEWTAERMREYGLENVRLEPWEIPVGWERGFATMKLVEPDNGRTLHIAARGWTPGTNGKVVGEVVFLKIRRKEDLEAYRGRLKNAVVLLTPPAQVAPVTDLRYGPPPAPTPVTGKKSDSPAPPSKSAEAPLPGKTEPASGGKTTTPPAAPSGRSPLPEWYSFRQDVYAFLRSEGVACMVSDAAKPHALLVTTGSWPTGDRGSIQDTPPAVFMAHEHFALLHRLIARPDIQPRVEVEIANTFVPGPITVFNTVGEIRGQSKPDEFVVVGAHLDSWDLASGTTDNGTGSCVVLETARALAALARQGNRPERTIRFVLFTGEEQGLFGSKEYVRRHKDEMPRTSAALVHDTGTGKVLSLGLQGREAVKTVLEPQLATLKSLGFEGLSLASMGGTDHLSFEAVGVPGFACRQDIDEYRLTHHTQSDTFDKAKAPNLLQGAQVLAITALRIANLPDLLPRTKPTPAKK